MKRASCHNHVPLNGFHKVRSVERQLLSAGLRDCSAMVNVVLKKAGEGRSCNGMSCDGG